MAAVKPKGGNHTPQELALMEQDYQTAYELYQLTRSYRAVGAEMGITHNTAQEYVNKHDAWLAVTTGNDNQLRRFNHATLDSCIARLMRQSAQTKDPDVLVRTAAIIERLVRTQNQMLGLNKPVSVQVEHQINVIPWDVTEESKQAILDIIDAPPIRELDA